MREFERIKRIVDLVSRLWSYNTTLPLGELLEKWIWKDEIQAREDIFRVEDTQTEQRLNEAIDKARSSLSTSNLNQRQTDLISTIRDAWPHAPDQRFGQFLSNYAFGHFLDHPTGMLLRQTDETILDALRSCMSA